MIILQKRIIMLRRNYYQTTATKQAKELCHHIISVDYLANIASYMFISRIYKDRQNDDSGKAD